MTSVQALWDDAMCAGQDDVGELLCSNSQQFEGSPVALLYRTHGTLSSLQGMHAEQMRLSMQMIAGGQYMSRAIPKATSCLELLPGCFLMTSPSLDKPQRNF